MRLGSDDPSFVPGQRSGGTKQYLLGLLNGPRTQGSSWVADFVAVNPTAAPLQVDLMFVPIGINSEPTVVKSIALAAGETRRIENVMEELWSLPAVSGLLIVEGGGALILGETYDDKGLLSYGQTVAPVVNGQGAGTGQRQALVGLREDGDYRTVVWLYNPSNENASLQAIYRKPDGTELGRRTVALPAGKARQMALREHPIGNYRGVFSVELQVTGGRMFSSAQVVNNDNNDPAYVMGQTQY